MCTLYNGWSEVKTLLQKIASTRECSNATTIESSKLKYNPTTGHDGHGTSDGKCQPAENSLEGDFRALSKVSTQQ